MKRPEKPAKTVRRAKTLRKEMSLPEVLLWQQLRRLPNGIRFRNQHPAGPFVLDFFCARANLAIEIDGISHDMGDRAERDLRRDLWLKAQRVDVIRIAAKDVLDDPVQVAERVLEMVAERLVRFGKAPASGLRPVISPSQADREDRQE